MGQRDSKRYRGALECLLVCLLLVTAVLLGGCERLDGLFEAAPGEATQAPPDSVEFEVDGDGVYYATLTRTGSLAPADRLAKVPLSARVGTIVHVLDETPQFDDRFYVANLLGAEPGQRHTAKLRPARYIDAVLDLGEAGARRALDVRYAADAMLGLDDEVLEPSTVSADSSGSAPPSSGTASRRHDAIELFADSRGGDDTSDQGPIEIHRVNPGGSSSATSGRGASGGGARWRPVTLYYADWCGVCRNARHWLDAKSVPYRAVDIGASDKNKSEMARFAKLKGARPYAVPTFRIGDDIMQGWSAKRFRQLARR
jgi:glutaredoxin